MGMNIRLFLRLQTDIYLTTLRDKLATEISDNVEFMNLSLGGKSISKRNLVKVTELAEALAVILVERELQGSNYKEKTRMTRVRFV